MFLPAEEDAAYERQKDDKGEEFGLVSLPIEYDVRTMIIEISALAGPSRLGISRKLGPTATEGVVCVESSFTWCFVGRARIPGLNGHPRRAEIHRTLIFESWKRS
jgi:hypothetical protein